jgi:starch synthase
MRSRILMVASELYPYVKTGGLADVISSLSRALAMQGADVQVILPGYAPLQSHVERVEESYEIDGPFAVKIPFRLEKCRLRGFCLPVWLVNCPKLYHHPGSIYEEPAGLDQSLNAMRFATLSWAAAALAAGKVHTWQPDILHCHDWHGALAPVFLRSFALSAVGDSPTSILTIHNLAFQGHFSPSFIDILGLRSLQSFGTSQIKSNTFCYLACGIAHADKVTTVSPTYAREILTAEHGCGLEGILRSRLDGILGILNGVDYAVWNPADDKHLPLNFHGFGQVERAGIRSYLQSECRLSTSATEPILTFTNRLTHQKMVDLLVEVLPEFIEGGAQFIAMGHGQPEYIAAVTALAEKYPRKVFYFNGYDEGLEHRIHAGGDICLSPSRFEPCGLNPLYAMRYGSVPVVRATGGLVDSIVDAVPMRINAGLANGVTFQDATAAGLRGGIQRAIQLFGDKGSWERVQRCSMTSTFRWKSAADQYRQACIKLTNDRKISRITKSLQHLVPRMKSHEWLGG